jgi:hypothetical protein
MQKDCADLPIILSARQIPRSHTLLIDIPSSTMLNEVNNKTAGGLEERRCVSPGADGEEKGLDSTRSSEQVKFSHY